MQTELTAISGTAGGHRQCGTRKCDSQLITHNVCVCVCVCVYMLWTPTSHHCPHRADKVHHLRFDAWFISKPSDTLVHSPAN